MSSDPSLARRLVEQFHLLFLSQLGRSLDKTSFAVKGGCNLRFFLRSIRYSEDMDLDIAPSVEVHALQDKVRAILRARPFASILQARGMAVEHATEQKQTDITQRWKFGLQIREMAVPLPTKIEFSRRGLDAAVRFESIDADLVREYRVPPLMVSHYGPDTAARQKVGALAHRTETQARDVFDLHHLVASGVPRDALEAVNHETAAKARANALGVEFAVFKSQVLSYLRPEDQAAYDSADVWEQMVLEVVDWLEGAVSA